LLRQVARPSLARRANSLLGRRPPMTEAEWLACTDPKGMLEFVDEKGSNRKKRLFAVACCRRIWSTMTDNRSQIAVEVAERFADGLASRREQEAAFEAARAAREENLAAAWELFDNVLGINPQADLPDNPALAAALICVSDAGPRFALEIDEVHRISTRRPGRRFKGKMTWAANTEHMPEEGLDACDLMHEVIGNPFSPVTVDPRWLTETVVALATGIYADRAFDRMPILADALEEAGCADEQVLAHCRGDGPHVRGCWVVDLVLGKA
jgi:hypothetical protein